MVRSLRVARGYQLMNYKSSPGFELEARKCFRTRTCSWCFRNSC
jgi:hypothetical protein